MSTERLCNEALLWKPPKRRAFAIVSALSLCALPFSVQAQRTRSPRISISAPQPAPIPDAARQRILQGEALFDRSNYEAALGEFGQAFELLRGHPRQYQVLFNMAQTNQRLFRYDEALEYFRRYLIEGPSDAPQRAEVEATTRVLDGLLGTIQVEVDAPSIEVWIDHHLVARRAGAIRVTGGRHSLEVRAPGYLPQRREVEVAARTSFAISVRLERVHRARGPGPWLFWSGLGVSLAFIAGGTGTGVGTLLLRSDVDARLADPLRRFSVSENDATSILRMANTTDILLGAALAFGIGTTIAAFVTDWRRPNMLSENPRVRTRQLIPSVLFARNAATAWWALP